MKNVGVVRMVKEIDEAWNRFIENMKKIQDKYRIGFVPANLDLWMNPACYKLRQLIMKEKNSEKQIELSFDSKKMRHKIHM